MPEVARKDLVYPQPSGGRLIQKCPTRPRAVGQPTARGPGCVHVTASGKHTVLAFA